MFGLVSFWPLLPRFFSLANASLPSSFIAKRRKDIRLLRVRQGGRGEGPLVPQAAEGQQQIQGALPGERAVGAVCALSAKAPRAKARGAPRQQQQGLGTGPGRQLWGLDADELEMLLFPAEGDRGGSVSGK